MWNGSFERWLHGGRYHIVKTGAKISDYENVRIYIEQLMLLDRYTIIMKLVDSMNNLFCLQYANPDKQKDISKRQ